LKTVKGIGLTWIDEDGHKWCTGAAIEHPTAGSPEALQDLAMKRLVEIFDEWRRG